MYDNTRLNLECKCEMQIFMGKPVKYGFMVEDGGGGGGISDYNRCTDDNNLSKLFFYVPFSSQGHTEKGPQHCHLWDSNHRRGYSL